MFKNIKQKVTDSTKKNGMDDVEVEVDNTTDEPTISIMEKMKNAGSEQMGKLKDKAGDVDIAKAVNNFSIKAVKTVEELDDLLLETNSNYEINNFLVSSSIGLHLGFRVDISMVKTKIAKDLQAIQTQNVLGKCPYCETQWKVPRTALAGKEKAKLKCSSCSKPFTIDTKTFQVIEE